MHIETIRVKNYKVFRNLELTNLPRLAIFVGANGSGKTTLFDVFGFLRDALNNNIRHALSKRGGFKEVRSRDQEGFIEIELQFRLEIAGKDRLVTYSLEIGAIKEVPYINREILRYKRGKYGSPFHFLDFSNGNGFAITNEEDFDKKDEELNRENQTLDSSDILAIKGLGQFERFKAANAFRRFIESWHVSDFHIDEARMSRDAGYAEHLSPTGENLPLVAQYLFESHRDRFEEVLVKLKNRVPGITSVKAKAMLDGRIVLAFQDGAFKDPFIARYVSDGTIKMFAYLLLLSEPNQHPLLCIEEPENQLYPTLLKELYEEFREYATAGGQVFISSHSPDFINGARPEEVFWFVKKNGFSTAKMVSSDKRLEAHYEEGELLGHLWKQGFFVGSNP